MILVIFAAVTLGLLAAVIADELLGHGLCGLIAEVPAGHPEFAYLDVELPIPARRTCECAIAGDFKCPYERCLERDWDEHDVLTTLAEISSL